MLGVNVTWDNEADARKFVEKYEVPYPVGRDASGEIGRRYKVEATPTTLLIKMDGTLFGRADGAMTEEEFKGNIEMLLKEKKK
jgi:cytochrome c biogenesis protein CcmG/thiol:disulfide interchange protein DsbE